MLTLVVCGAEDDDNGSAAELADDHARCGLPEVPGTHMSSVTKPELGQAIVDFLTDKKGAPESAPPSSANAALVCDRADLGLRLDRRGWSAAWSSCRSI